MLKNIFGGGAPAKAPTKQRKSVSFRDDLNTTSETSDPPELSAGSEPTLKKLRNVMTDTSALIPIEQLEQLSLLGEGNNDFVWKCKWTGPAVPASVKQAGGLVALKQRKVVVRPPGGASTPASEKSLSDRELAAFAKELLVVKSLSHPNIVAYIGATLLRADDGHDEIAIVQEYAPYGTLRPLIYEQASLMRSFSVADGVRWAHQIALGMTFLHSCTPAIIHRNLKPENILIASPNGTAKIADFGLIAFEGGSSRKPAPRDAADNQLASSFGSLHYLAPEVYRGEGSTHKADVYSFGMLLFELLMRRPAFHGMLEGENVAHGAAHNALRPPMPSGWPLPAKELVKRAWDPYPATRAEFETIGEELERWLEPGSDLLKKLTSASPKLPLEYLGQFTQFSKSAP